MILKSSKKYIIINKNNYVYKISKNNSQNNIIKEYRLLINLKKDKRYSKFLPKIYELGIIKNGILKGNYYYKQDLVLGKTFSTEIQTSNNKKLNKFYIDISKQLISICQNSKENKNINKNTFVKNIFNDEIKILKQKKDLNTIIKKNKIVIENINYNNLEYYLKEIFNSSMYKKLIKYFKISKNEHWNFHGDNIIIKNNKFKLIDPDTSIILNDSLFSYCRFLYTFLHDTCFYKKYYIKTNDLFYNNSDSIMKFKLNLIWPINIENNYKEFFSFINYENYKNDKIIKELKINQEEIFRIKLIYLYCLVRGINRNYQKQYYYLNNLENNIQIDHIYLYLNSLICAKSFLKFIKNG